MNRIFFNSDEELFTYARNNGGWCAICDDGTFQWFDPLKWTLTPVIKAVGCSAEIGPLDYFVKGPHA